MIFKMLAEWGFTPYGRPADLEIQTRRLARLPRASLVGAAQPSTSFVPLYR
jgi:hypothetical protein